MESKDLKEGLEKLILASFPKLDGIIKNPEDDKILLSATALVLSMHKQFFPRDKLGEQTKEDEVLKQIKALA